MVRLCLLLIGNNRSAVDEELEFHLERRVEANVAAGMTAEDARRLRLVEGADAGAARVRMWRVC